MDGYAYVDRARTGETNMAIDRRLLEIADRRGCAILRVYQWIQPTLSLGHFQATLPRSSHPPSASLPAVLRASGGGAIVHHHDWTYSISVPVIDHRMGAAPDLYNLVHTALVELLRNWGWDAQQWNTELSRSSMTDPGSYLCFQRRSCGDIVCQGSKVVGSAQRRLGKAVLQHGSLLCSTSPYAPELTGLTELPRTLDRSYLSEKGDKLMSPAIAQNCELEIARFGDDMLSWVVAPLFGSLGVDTVSSQPPSDLAELSNAG